MLFNIMPTEKEIKDWLSDNTSLKIEPRIMSDGGVELEIENPDFDPAILRKFEEKFNMKNYNIDSYTEVNEGWSGNVEVDDFVSFYFK